MFWPSSLQFWRPLPGCCVPFPSAASGSGGQRFACVLPGCGVPFPSAARGPGSQGFGALSPGTVRLFPPQRAARAARGLAPFPLAQCAFSLRGEWPGQPEVWRPLHGRAAPFPSTAPARAATGICILKLCVRPQNSHCYKIVLLLGFTVVTGGSIHFP